MALVYRSIKGSALTTSEVDGNFQHFLPAYYAASIISGSTLRLTDFSGDHDDIVLPFTLATSASSFASADTLEAVSSSLLALSASVQVLADNSGSNATVVAVSASVVVLQSNVTSLTSVVNSTTASLIAVSSSLLATNATLAAVSSSTITTSTQLAAVSSSNLTTYYSSSVANYAITNYTLGGSTHTTALPTTAPSNFTIDGVALLTDQTSTPTQVDGGLMVSGSKLYFGTGGSWREVSLV